MLLGLKYLGGRFIRRDASFCPLLGNSGQSRILARDRLSAYGTKRTSPSELHVSASDPKRTLALISI